MKKESVQKIVKVSKYIDDNKATILTYMGVAGVFGTAYLAVKAKPKAEELIAKKEAYICPCGSSGPCPFPSAPLRETGQLSCPV